MSLIFWAESARQAPASTVESELAIVLPDYANLFGAARSPETHPFSPISPPKSPVTPQPSSRTSNLITSPTLLLPTAPAHPIPNLPSNPALSAARNALIDATKALHALAVGPAETTRLFCSHEINFVGVMQVLCHFRVPQCVPIDGEIGMKELASRTGLSEKLLPRFLRMAAANYYFAETRPGVVAHTAFSRLLAEDERMRACVWFRCVEMMPAVAKFVQAVERFPRDGGAVGVSQETAFELAFGDTFFGYKEKHPEHMTKFGLFVDAFAGGSVDPAESVARAYAWEKLPAGSLVVDIGGGIGHVSAAVAREHGQLNFQIQDFAGLAGESKMMMEKSGVSERISFEPHSFFEPQPHASREATVYFLRNIMHNWPDHDCRRILKPLVEAMGPDSRIVICDIVLPEPNTILKTEEVHVRALDMIMLSMLNAKERSYAEWQDLFASVDPRLRITTVVGKPKLQRDCLIEVRLVQ
ncbi:hypothetical protein N0V88_005730 [Collariella sp. IMI 366227]|nr:hypothetical protein N0V88_005730 [Collariella sp. IMI 366227]